MFVAGASGVIGVRLVPLLVAAGHVVAGMTRTPAKQEQLRALGAQAVLADVFDAEALRRAVVTFSPEAVIDELTDLPDDQTRLEVQAALNIRIRREGTRNVIAAAQAAKASKILAQSVAWRLPGERGAAVDDLEHAVLEAGGIVLRYGQLYGPGTYFENDKPPPPRIHIDDAARRTVRALDAPSGVIELAENGSGRS